MASRETVRYDMFGRAVTFGKLNAADFTPDSEATTRFGNVANIITGLDSAKASQKPATATAISLDEPGFDDNFRPPTGSNERAVVTAADAILSRLIVQSGDDAATQSAKTALVAKELPATFAQDLLTDRQAVGSAKDNQEGSREGGVKSTSAVGRLIAAGMKEVKYPDAIMHNKYARNADKLRAWLSASHIERPAQRAKQPPTTTTPPAK